MSDVTSEDGTRLALFSWGSRSAPLVVLVHGLGLSTDAWGSVPDLLSRTHRVVAYDLRGHGQSGDAKTGDYSMAAHAGDLDAVLSDVAGSAPAVVVGHSLGGAIIIERARLCGNGDVSGAVLVGSSGSAVTFPGFSLPHLPRRGQLVIRLAWLKALRAAAPVARQLRAVETISNRLVRRLAFTSDDPDTLVHKIRDEFLSSRPDALVGTTFASGSLEGTRSAPFLEVPTLVLHGARDSQAPAAEVRKLVAALPRAELVSLPDEGHMLPLTRGSVVAEQVARWVGRIGKATSE